MMIGSTMATDTTLQRHTPAKIRDGKHQTRPIKALNHDDTIPPPRPPTPSPTPSPSRKSSARKALEADRGPNVRDYMTSEEFRSWVADMGYPKKRGMTSVDRIPYRHEPICWDLGIQPNRFYAYWRGTEKKEEVTINPQITRLCMCLLARRRAAALMDDLVRKHPECGDMIRQIAASLVMPKVHLGVSDLRSRAALLRQSAVAVASETTRDALRKEADELEMRALAIEQKSGVLPIGAPPGSRPAERDKSKKAGDDAPQDPQNDAPGDEDLDNWGID